MKQTVYQTGKENGFDWSETTRINTSLLRFEKDSMKFTDAKPALYLILGDLRRLKMARKGFPEHQGKAKNND